MGCRNLEKYESLEADLIDDGLDINLEILKGGYSPEYSVFPLSRQAEFADAASLAQSQDVGLWAACGSSLGRPTAQLVGYL